MTCGNQYAPQLRARGFRMTPQRMAILHVLHHSGGHLSPGEVYQQASHDIPGLTEGSTPGCASDRTLITFAIHDDARNKDKSWSECVQGSLANLTTEDAGPDTAAARVPQAAILARNYTVGENFVSAYAGSVMNGRWPKMSWNMSGSGVNSSSRRSRM